MPGVKNGNKKRRSFECMKYDVIIVGAGPGGIYSAYELTKKCGGKKIAVFD